MAKLLSVDNMLEAAHDLRLKNLEQYINLFEAAAAALAEDIAERTGVVTGEATWEGVAFGGLCASFYAPNKKKKCPAAIHRGDPGGDWEMDESTKREIPRPFEVQHEFDFEPTYVCPLDEGQDKEEGRTVTFGKNISWQSRQVLAEVIAEFLSRSEDSR